MWSALDCESPASPARKPRFCAWGLPELMRGILGIFLVSRRLASIAARLLEGLSFVIAGIWDKKPCERPGTSTNHGQDVSKVAIMKTGYWVQGAAQGIRASQSRSPSPHAHWDPPRKPLLATRFGSFRESRFRLRWNLPWNFCEVF